MSATLQLNQVRAILTRLEETIIFALIERAQYRRNEVIYQPGAFGDFLDGKSLVDHMLYECECSHSRVRRYTSPDEHPFFSDLPSPQLPALGYDENPLQPNTVNLNKQIRDGYKARVVSAVCRPGDDHQYGSSAVCDVYCLQALSKRIHYGKFVAESKYREQADTFKLLIRQGDREALHAAITNEVVESDVVERVRQKAKRYTEELSQLADASVPDAQVIADLYRDWIIPLNKQVQIAYLIEVAGNPTAP